MHLRLWNWNDYIVFFYTSHQTWPLHCYSRGISSIPFCSLHINGNKNPFRSQMCYINVFGISFLSCSLLQRLVSISLICLLWNLIISHNLVSAQSDTGLWWFFILELSSSKTFMPLNHDNVQVGLTSKLRFVWSARGRRGLGFL